MSKKETKLTEQQRHFVMSGIIFVAVGIVLAGGYFILQSSRTTRDNQVAQEVETSEASSQLSTVQAERLATNNSQLEQAVDDPEETASLLRNKATLQEKSGDVQGAIDSLIKSLETEDPSDIVEVNVRFKLATLYSTQDKFDSALEQINILINTEVLFDTESKDEAQARKSAYEKQELYDDSRVCEGEDGEDEPC